MMTDAAPATGHDPVLEVRMAAAFRAGRQAVQKRKPLSECPYDRESEDSRERVCAIMWLRGWTAGNPVDLDAALPE